MNISISITGSRETIAKLEKLGSKLMMLEGAMESIGKQLSDYYGNQAFLSQGGVFGNRWPRLKTTTSVYKAAHYRGAPPEYRTGDMMHGFKYSATSRSVRVYNEMPYFEYQNSGTNRLPARQMIGVNSKVKSIIKDTINAEIQAKLRAL